METAPKTDGRRMTPEEKIDSLQRRFLAATLVAGENECWINEKKHLLNHEGKLWAPHKVAYFLSKGMPPTNSKLVRTCANTLCVNPAHVTSVREIFESQNHIIPGSRFSTVRDEMMEMIANSMGDGPKAVLDALTEQFFIIRRADVSGS